MKRDRHEHRRAIRSIEDAAAIPPPWLHPLAGAKWSHFRKILDRHRGRPRSRFRRWFNGFALLERSPLATVEDWLYGGAVAAHEPAEAPLFLIGHWGSGTTRLHRLLSLDPQFAYPDNGHTLMPWNLFSTSRYCRAYVRPAMPEDRLFDGLPASLEDPQEEEIALAAMGPISYFLSLYFPSDAVGHIRRALFPETADPADREAFENAYRLFHRRISLLRGGRRLLFKNPASTTRMPLLRRLFPGAKFVHLVRNPFEVYASAMNRTPFLLHGFALEEFRDLDLRELTLETYELLMRRYLRDRVEIPAGEIVEVRFEELASDPLATAETIYEKLGLPGKARALREMRNVVDAEPPFARKGRTLTAADSDLVRERWRFSFAAWGYDPAPLQGDA